MIFFFILLLFNKALLADELCLFGGQVGTLKNGKCHLLNGPLYQTEKNKVCPNAKVMCNPLVFGESVCLEIDTKSEEEELKACLQKAKDPDQVVLNLNKDTPPYKELDQLLQNFKGYCDPDLGEKAGIERCKIFYPRLLLVEKALDKKEKVVAKALEGPAVTVNPIGQIIVNPQSFGAATKEFLEFAEKLNKKKRPPKKLGQQPTSNSIYDLEGKRGPIKNSSPEMKQAQESVLPILCLQTFKSFSPENFKIFFDLAYLLFIQGDFSDKNSSDQKVVFCFLKKESESHLQEANNVERLMAILSKVPTGQKWDCP